MRKGLELKFYGRRLGRPLNAAQKQLWEDGQKRWGFELPDKTTEGPQSFVDLPRLFGPDIKSYALEIGFGGGEHLLWQAQRNPDCGFIGCEPFITGNITVMRQLQAEGINNVRLYPENARDLVQVLPPNSFSRAFILFPDPWPKKRHHKRRIVSAAMLEELARILQPGAILRMASDIDDYVTWMLEHVSHNPDFEWLAHTPDDWKTRPDDWPATRYEQKALAAGRSSAYLEFRRK